MIAPKLLLRAPGLLAILSLCGTACSDPATVEVAGMRSEVTQLGDTTVITTYGEPDRVRGGEVEVVWQSPELEDPQALLSLDDRLVVADRYRVHILRDRGRHVRTVGRHGEGPGEFGFLLWLSRLGPDTVAVYDGLNYRMSFLTPEGDFFGSARVTPRSPFINPLTATERGGTARGLVPVEGGVLTLWRDGHWGDGSRPTRTALVWLDISADTLSVRESWDGERWISEGGYGAPTQLFGPRVISALALDGRLAIGNGTDYCIAVHAVMEGEVRKFCRDREPAPVGAGIRHPDLSRIEDARRRQSLEKLIPRQHLGEHLPQFDRMLFDEEGRLWVRTIGPEFSEVSPYLLRDEPELGPERRTWDVFDRGGHLLSTIEIPSNLEPQAITSEEIYGFVELTSGEIAIGASAIPRLEYRENRDATR